MSLCYVECLSQFESKLDFYEFLKITQKLGQSPCARFTGRISPKMKGENSHFLWLTCSYLSVKW